MNKKVQDAFNYQLNRELYSAYLYLSMAAYLESVKLVGFAVWMVAQAGEERTHAMKLYRYLTANDGRVELAAVEEPPRTWDSPLEVFEHVYAHEQKVTGLIDKLVALVAEEDYQDADDMLQWFVDEQVEEEESASDVLKKLKRIGGDEDALAKLDSEMGKRGTTPPSS